MKTIRKKRFFTNHSKSSAMLVSLALHAILLLVALSFVAVTVVTKEDKKFESRQVTRPRMPPKKLQVPVKIKKQKRKPKLRQRIVVKSVMNRSMPDIKMPEISGVKGGLGAAGATGLGDGGGIGFSMPEIEIFGVKGKGEKVFIALDSDAIMMRDEVGGMRAYTIIKDELKEIIGNLGPTTLFNLAVFDHGGTTTLFPQMAPATQANVAKVDKWLDPLNKVSAGMGDKAYGTKTIGPGGTRIHDREEFSRGTVKWSRHWYLPSAVAMKQHADTVFVLTGWWGVQRHATGKTPEWSETKKKRWDQYVREGKEKWAQENKERKADGEPPKVLRDDHHIVVEYFPSQYASVRRPEPDWYWYTAKDFAESIKVVRKENASRVPVKSGLSKKKKDRYSINIIFFARKDAAQGSEIERFSEFSRRCGGKFRSISGLEAIEGSTSGAGN